MPLILWSARARDFPKNTSRAGGTWVFRAAARGRGKKLPRIGSGRMLQMCNKFAFDFLVGAGLGGLRRGLPAAFRAATGARFSLSPILRDFGEDESVKKDSVETMGR